LPNRPAAADPREREVWDEERRGTVVLLAALADYDADFLRRAATGEWVSPDAGNLACRGDGGAPTLRPAF
jgi:hypothetical protein